MTVEEAIEAKRMISFIAEGLIDVKNPAAQDTLTLVHDNLGKEIPKEVVRYSEWSDCEAGCPRCGKFISLNMLRCEYCGQKLDWESFRRAVEEDNRKEE